MGTRILGALPPQVAHALALRALRYPWVSGLLEAQVPAGELARVGVDVPVLGRLPHPIGLAAGFDKNAEVVEGLFRLGFAAVEVGTVTPQMQSGNQGQVFLRQRAQGALINRLGFPSQGSQTVAMRLEGLGTLGDRCCLGVNIGKNRATPLGSAIHDYSTLALRFGRLARYLTVNISSPNTPGLRDLQSIPFLRDLGQSLGPLRERTFVKLDPDLDREPFQALVGAVAEARFAGLVLTNTRAVSQPLAGGQSGHPLLLPSTTRLEWAWEVHKGALTTVGVGGILSGRDILEKVLRGAHAVQIYSSLVLRGPRVVADLISELCQEMDRVGVRHISDLWGQHYSR